MTFLYICTPLLENYEVYNWCYCCYRLKNVIGHLDGSRDFPRLAIG